MSNKESKNERERSFPEKLKKFLKSDKKNNKSFPEVKITEEMKLDLGPNSAYDTRLNTLKELEESIQIKKLQDTCIENILVQVRDLLNENSPLEIRHAVLSLLSAIAATTDNLGQKRVVFMKFIKDSYQYEDAVPLFNFFQYVINDGRNIEYIEEEVGPFLIKWLPSVFRSFHSSVAVIDLITNLLKFNAAHFDDFTIRQLALCIINQLFQSKTKEEIFSCLKFMETLIAYVYIPNGTLAYFVSALARLVSIPFIVEDAWKVMRNLLRTELGSAAVCSLCELVETSDNFHIVRGSIYFITCALWSKQKISSLATSPVLILPTLLKASESLYPLVIYETAISISKLMRNYPKKDLQIFSWELMMDILERLFYFTENHSEKEQAKMIFNILNGTIDEIESAIEREEFKGSLAKFYDLVDSQSQQREVHSVHMLLEYKIQSLKPDQNHWLAVLNSLIHRHFREDTRPPVRLQTLSKLRNIFDRFKGTIYAEKICQFVLIHQLEDIEKESELVVRKAAVSLLIHVVIHLQVTIVEKLLIIIEKIVLAPYAVHNLEKRKTFKDNEADDVYEGVRGLILIFKKKIWCLPSSFAIQAYHILMSSLELHYRNPEVLENIPCIRRAVFEMIFEMRADADYHLGLPNCPDAQIQLNPEDTEDLKNILPKYTPYIVVDHKYGQKPTSGYAIYNESSRRSSYEEDDELLIETEALNEVKKYGEKEGDSVEAAATVAPSLTALATAITTQATVQGLAAATFSSKRNEVGVGNFKTDSKINEVEDKEEIKEEHKVPIWNKKQTINGVHPNVENIEENVKKEINGESKVGMKKEIDEEIIEEKTVPEMVEDSNDKVGDARNEIFDFSYKNKKTRTSSFSELDLSEPLTVVTHLSLTKAAMTVIVAMKIEKDWSLLKMILEKIPQVLQNKALILSKDGHDIDYLATTLCALISDESLNIPSCLRNTPPKFSKSDFDAYVYPVMASLSSYHQYLDTLYQRNIIQCLQNGMLSKSAPQCVSAMTLCVLEMRNTMAKLLRDAMIRLSKISATVQNAQPTLEFLSTLLHLPRVYSDFLPNQYLSVFAISIPYTNPFKFNHYIVSLAYHVICMWFMKCRVPLRKGFVNFISKNLNMILVNEESSSKHKSASNDQLGKGEIDRIQFHKDLRETCVDFMARNCFDSYAPETIRSPVSQMLFNRGQQQTWLLGTRIITITTSGCSKKPIKQGLCDKCVQHCLSEDPNSLDVSPPQNEPTASRRRHKSDFHRSVSHEVKHEPQSKDDLHMRSTFREFQTIDQGEKLRNIDDLLYNDQLGKKNYMCSCWCSRWAEIMIRQPTGNVSYAMRILNPQTHIVKEELVPIQDLSSFYSPFTQGTDLNLFRRDISFQESLYDSYASHPVEDMRPRAASGGSDHTQTSETGLAFGEEWSNSGSGPSSGTASLASSETKLNFKAEIESTSKDPNSLPVCHCYSSPEVNKGLMEGGDLSEVGLKHQPLAHSVSLVEQPLKNSEHDHQASSSSSHSSQEKSKIKPGGSVVKRCNSSVGSSSPSPIMEQTSRMRHASAMQTKSCASPLTICDKEDDPSLQPMKRGRGHTISDMNPASRNKTLRNLNNRRPTIASASSLTNSTCVTTASLSSLPNETSASTSNTVASSYSTSLTSSSKSGREIKGGVSPSSVFLQLFYQGCFGSSCLRPILLPTQNKEVERAIKLMDLVKPHEHHRIGVLYVGPNQRTEVEIFSNTSGSERYHQFLEGIGSVYEIKDFSENTNLGGLDKRGVDGHLIHMWQDDLMQVVFHVATTMPNKETDPNGNNKKQHIGNDNVTIVYNNSGRPYDLNTIKSQFNHFVVEITPGDHSTNCVKLLTKPALAEFVSWDNSDVSRLVSDASLPLLGRQLAIHANLASTVWQSLKRSQYLPYATNWLEWLRKVRKLRELVLGKQEADRHLQEMQNLQFPAQDSNEHQPKSYLDFSDMIEPEKQQEAKERSRTAGFLNRR